ncbi:hypothetical protein C8Q75DRAFT_812277 [Abortiporus biennis]|nr:hypothetical protein C8Q75DRAFT_812277 [Abortiporus biennis]
MHVLDEEHLCVISSLRKMATFVQLGLGFYFLIVDQSSDEVRESDRKFTLLTPTFDKVGMYLLPATKVAIGLFG